MSDILGTYSDTRVEEALRADGVITGSGILKDEGARVKLGLVVKKFMPDKNDLLVLVVLDPAEARKIANSLLDNADRCEALALEPSKDQ